MTLLEGRLSISEIRQIRKQSYGAMAAKTNFATTRDLDEYRAILPWFQDKNVTELISEKIAQGIDPVRVLDIGCGKGIFLKELSSIYPQVEAYGISAHDFSDKDMSSSSKMHYEVGDAHNLARIFRGIGFDLIVSVFAMNYMVDPLAVLKQAYHLLRERGIILIDYLDNPVILDSEKDALSKKWDRLGIENTFRKYLSNNDRDYPSDFGLVLQKGPPNLPLPFRYHSYSSIADRLIYALDERKLDSI